MKLPSVYANRIDKLINNNSSFYRNSEDRNIDLSKLKLKFDSRGFGDRIPVEIETKNGKSLEKLVLCKNNYFVTINNKKIYFDEIVNYSIKK